MLTGLSITIAFAVGYLVAAGIFHWDTRPKPEWAGLLLIVVGGLVWLNAVTLDAVNRDQTRRRPTTTPSADGMLALP
jgi:hypothetical protein